jgi:hypothetical protein
MRARSSSAGAILLVGSLALSIGLAACFDLFHSTRDILTACELDAMVDGCAGDAGATADFCSWSRAEAQAHARHSCAWLGACESPMGKNAFGSCEFAALLAFDCAANPNHHVQGQARMQWDCLQRAETCAEVHACVFPAGSAVCASPGDYTACVQSGGLQVRTECTDGGTMPYPNASGECCTLWGQSCASAGGVAECAGAEGGAGVACAASECSGSALHWCDPTSGADIGIDCADNGDQGCAGFPSASAAEWVACLPSSDGGACVPDASATCAGGVAYACPSGVVEQIDCSALLGTPDACAPGPLSPPFEWTSPCVSSLPACTGDSCSGTVLTGCARGATFSVDCAQEGLGSCRTMTTDLGSQVHAACTPP